MNYLHPKNWNGDNKMWYSVNMNGVLQMASAMGGYAQSVEAYKERVSKVYSACPGSGSVRLGLRNSLIQIMEELNSERRLFNKMEEMLEECVSCYQTYEVGIARCQSNVSVSWGEEEKTDSAEDIGEPIWSWGDTWKMLGNFGIIGSTLGAIGNVVTGGWNVNSVLGSAEFVNSIVGGVAGMAGATDAKWKYLLGMDDALGTLAGNSGGSFWEAFKGSAKSQILDDLGFNGAATTADKVKVGTKWAGHVLSLAINGVENYQEFEGQGAYGVARGTAETVVETAVDIGLGIGATALVSAGATVLVSAGVITAAPAVAVGAVAAGVVWAANGVCKWVTGGRDLGEVTADFVCDVGEGAVELAKKGAEKVADVAKDIGKGVKEGVSTAWNKVCSIFG